jgi:hypothetical protein
VLGGNAKVPEIAAPVQGDAPAGAAPDAPTPGAPGAPTPAQGGGK